MATKIGFDASLANTGVDWVTVGNDVVKTLKQQRQLSKAIKRARYLHLLPFVTSVEN